MASDNALERALLAGIEGSMRGPGAFSRGMIRGVVGAVRGAQALGRLADDLLYPDWTDAELGSPLWIVACPRSGTTFLHRLLSLDEEHFTSLQLYQSLIPGVAVTRGVERMAELEAKLGRPLRRAISAVEGRLFGDFDHIHRVAFDEPEEDEALFLAERASPAWLMFMPYHEQMREHVWADELPEEERSALVERYVGMLKRHVHAQADGRTLLMKNALIAGRLGIVEEAVPRARYIHLVRDPYRSVTSLVSMFHTVLESVNRSVRTDGPSAQALARIGCAYYLAYHRHFESLSPERVLTLRYRDLIASPRQSVERIYGHFGMEIGDAFARRLDAKLAEQKSYSSSHSYSLEKFGLVPSDIHEPLAEVFDAYGFERRSA